MRIAAIKLRQLGDTVLWTATLHALRQWKPEAEIHLVVPPAYRDLFLEDARWAGVWSENEVEALKKKGPMDWALAFHANPRARRIAKGMAAKTTVVHHHSRQPKPYGSDVSIPNLGQPASAQERDANVLRALGWAGTLEAPHLPTTPAAAPDLPHPVAILGPATTRRAKQWPLDAYAALGRRLRAAGWHVRTITPPTPLLDRLLLQQLESECPPIPTPDLARLTAVLAAADLYIGSDSGAKHLAAAVGTRTVTLFGPESVGEWHGYDPKVHPVLRHRVSCRNRDSEDPDFAWCGESTCPLASHACMTLTTPEAVMETIEQSFGPR